VTLWEHVTTPDGEYGTRRLVQWGRNAAGICLQTLWYEKSLQRDDNKLSQDLGILASSYNEELQIVIKIKCALQKRARKPRLFRAGMNGSTSCMLCTVRVHYQH
jgi:hypothetical protein